MIWIIVSALSKLSCSNFQAATAYMGRVERGEQNISIQNLIQITITLHVEIASLVPSLRQLKDTK